MRFRLRLTRAAALVAVISPCLSLVADWSLGAHAEFHSATDATSSHAKMIGVLEEIRRRTPDENPFLGEATALRLRAQLAALPGDAPERARVNLQYRLGVAELFLGNERQAIDQLSSARTQFSSAQATPAGAAELDFRLGLAYMRLGETQNCCLRHNPESCILPIQGGGIHTVQEGSVRAIEYFSDVLKGAAEGEPVHLRARWLLNIAYMTLGQYPHEVPESHLIPPEAFESDEPFPRFTNIAPQLGLNTFSLSGGAIADDFDNDGYLDLLVSTWDTSGQIRFFLNERDGTFSERTTEAGLEGLYGGLNLLQADYDNDGNVDALVLRGAWCGTAGRHPNSLLHNNGDGTFIDMTFAAGLAEVSYPTQTASWADYDNDGDLDLYVGNESTDELLAPCQLFRNEGDGTFLDVAGQAGVENYYLAKAVVWGDYDDDRFPDLYVSNLNGENRLYRNNRDGTFSDVARDLSVATPLKSFPAWFWDFDNDGVLDLYVSSYATDIGEMAAAYLNLPFESELARLYRGDGHGGFEDVTTQRGLARPASPMGSNFGDVDNDGYLDFYLGTGDVTYESLMPNVLYHNRGGERFADVTTAGGFGHLQKGHAVVFADLDHDGDQDIFEQMGGAYPGDRFGDSLYENPGFGTHWITVKIVGVTSNRSAIGARISLDVVDESGWRRSIYRHVNSGGTFGANPLRQTIGLGAASHIERLEVFWPTTAQRQVYTDMPLDAAVEIVEGQEEFTILTLRRYRLGEQRPKKGDL